MSNKSKRFSNMTIATKRIHKEKQEREAKNKGKIWNKLEEEQKDNDRKS